MKAKTTMLPTPENLTVDEIRSYFATEETARIYLEEIRWPTGVVCPHCKNADQSKIWEIKVNRDKKIRAGLRQCAECKKQFTVTVGTIFEDSHIPLNKWLWAWYLLCTSKKGISALQVKRMLWGENKGSYRTALFMMHRIRHALKHPNFEKPLSGVVEVDETYIGGKKTGQGVKAGKAAKVCVVSLVQRGGDKRSMVMERVTVKNLIGAIREHVEVGSIVMTDEFGGYQNMPKIYTHKPVKHSAKEYARREGDLVVHTNTAETSFSLLKRGLNGTFHHVSKKHLPLYLAEFDYRYNNRKTTDVERTAGALKMAEGKRLTLKPLKATKV